jgi:hypothetical protein
MILHLDDIIVIAPISNRFTETNSTDGVVVKVDNIVGFQVWTGKEETILVDVDNLSVVAGADKPILGLVLLIGKYLGDNIQTVSSVGEPHILLQLWC